MLRDAIETGSVTAARCFRLFAEEWFPGEGDPSD
jgi:hypothetical protein